MPVIVTFVGEYDIATKDEVRAELDSIRNDRDVILDFSRVTYVDSVILSELIRAQAYRSDNSLPQLTIVVKEGSMPRRVLALTGLENEFSLTQSLDAAVQDETRYDVRSAVQVIVSRC